MCIRTIRICLARIRARREERRELVRLHLLQLDAAEEILRQLQNGA
jgi:hypothetical protein